MQIIVNLNDPFFLLIFFFSASELLPSTMGCRIELCLSNCRKLSSEPTPSAGYKGPVTVAGLSLSLTVACLVIASPSKVQMQLDCSVSFGFYLYWPYSSDFSVICSARGWEANGICRYHLSTEFPEWQCSMIAVSCSSPTAPLQNSSN